MFLLPHGREPSCQVLLIVLLCGVIIVISPTIPKRLAGGFIAALLAEVVEAVLVLLFATVESVGRQCSCSSHSCDLC